MAFTLRNATKWLINRHLLRTCRLHAMVEQWHDTGLELVLGSSGATRAGSSPVSRIFLCGSDLRRFIP